MSAGGFWGPFAVKVLQLISQRMKHREQRKSANRALDWQSQLNPPLILSIWKLSI